MKPRILLFSFACSLLTLPGLRAADQPAHKHGDHDHTELGEHMEEMSGAYRRLGRQINDPARNQESLKLVETLRTNAQAALELEPAKAADVPPAERAAFVVDFRSTMKRFISDLEKLESALKQGNNAEAAELLKTVKKDQEEGHKKFRKKKAE